MDRCNEVFVLTSVAAKYESRNGWKITPKKGAQEWLQFNDSKQRALENGGLQSKLQQTRYLENEKNMPEKKNEDANERQSEQVGTTGLWVACERLTI